MKKLISILALIVIVLIFLGGNFITSRAVESQNNTTDPLGWWEVQSIDSVKYSRDVAREKAKDTSFDQTIDKQVSAIVSTGATHIAIGTPYDKEFIPFLTRWVITARKYNLKVWFRGNMSGWEGWFGYKKISRDEHIKQIQEFILGNGALFEEGDIFSACPECENGGPGDPRSTGDVKGHRQFLIDEYKITNDSFRKIGKNVRSNFVPMNGDVAYLVMDKQTTRDLGGIVVIDHYVKNPSELATDIEKIAEKSGGKVVLGEFGAPIPDLNGSLTEEQQAIWINEALTGLSEISELSGVNYWVGFGGTTALWKSGYSEKPAVKVLRSFFKPEVISGRVNNEIGKPVGGAKVSLGIKTQISNKDGTFTIPYISDKYTLKIEASGYKTQEFEIGKNQDLEVVVKKENEDIIFRIWKFLYRLSKG